MAKIHINNPKQVINGGAKKYYFKVKGLGGPKGDKGDKGDTGATGPEGPQGNAATVSIGSTTTLPVGYDATVTNSGSIYNAVLNFGIPQGPRGPQGATGAKGDKGDKGDQGNPGPQGEKGTNATVTVGTTTTTEPGTQAYAWNSSSNPSNAVINFNIPRGATGSQGPQGIQGPIGPAGADGESFTPVVVSSLPTTGDEGKLYLTPKDYTTSTATGNPIEATITAQAGQLESFQLDGDTYQQSYTGKNLLRLVGVSDSGLTGTVNADGSITITGKATRSGGLRVFTSSQTINSGAYTLTISSALPAVLNMTVATNVGFRLESGATSVTTTLTQEYSSASVFFAATSGQEYDLTVKIQLVAGSTPDYDFEPFVGGQASPSPEYSQQIQTVTGLQTVSVATSLITTDTELENSRLNSNGVINLNISNRLCTSEYIQVEPNTTYLFDVKDGAKQVQTYFVGYASTNGVGIGNYPNGANWANPPFSITTDSNCHYVKVGMRFSDDSDITPNDISEIELLAPATTYPISLGSIELCKLGTYQDYIWKDGDDWKVHKATVSAIIDGSESWDTSGTNTFYVANIYSKIGDSIQSASTGEMYASHFTIADITSSNTLVGASLRADAAHNVSNLRIRLQDMSGGVEGFRQMLSAKKPSIYARRLTPTETTITDTTLIAQLEAIRTASLENGTNTITNTATGTNLAGDMEIGYYGFNPTNRYDKFIWLDLNNNYEQIGGE